MRERNTVVDNSVRASFVCCFAFFLLTKASDASDANQLINFAGIKADDKVAEFLPNDAPLSQRICDAIGAKGHLYSVHMPKADVATTESQALIGCYHTSIILRARNFPAPELHSDSDDPGWVYEYFAQRLPIESFIAPEPLDALFAIDRYHELHTKQFGAPNMRWVNTSLLQALKPGGMLIVQDRALNIDVARVKKELIIAGFEFIAEYSLSGNSRDHYLLKFRRP